MFVLLQVGDLVFIQSLSTKGTIQSINPDNSAIIKTTESELVSAHLHNLVKLKKEEKQKKKEVYPKMKQFTNILQNIVLNFQQKFNHPAEEKPTLPSLERFTNRKGFGTIEESVEQLHTLSNNEEEFLQAAEKLKVALDVAIEKQKDKEYITDITEKLAALADGLGDELWFLLGDAVEAGIDMEPIIKIISDSNMSKLFTDENGNKYAKQNELGKIIKSPDFFEPEPRIKEEILRQLQG